MDEWKEGWSRWKGSVVRWWGESSEKCATLGIIRGRGPQAKRSGRGRVATFSEDSPHHRTSNSEFHRLRCRRMDPRRRYPPKTSFGVPADGPQTPISHENVVWGACRWTSDDDIPQKRRLGCLPMDPKRRLEWLYKVEKFCYSCV